MKRIFFFVMFTFAAMAGVDPWVSDYLAKHGGNGQTAHDRDVLNAPSGATTASVVKVSTADSNIIARAQQAASILQKTNVAAVIAITGPIPDAIQNYLETHLAQVGQTTVDDFRNLNDIWPEIAPWCNGGTVANFASTITATNQEVTLHPSAFHDKFGRDACNEDVEGR